ncbi:MAG: hypothetical protein RLY43_941 [Bacteroidota bacterium]|jgi:glycosyltransferase involved in cell wall biosynthesis
MFKRIIHLVPQNGIGGVEASAATLPNASCDNFSYSVEYISNLATYNINIFRQITFFYKAIVRVIKLNPDILICSLWKSAFIGCILKLIKPNIVLVCFLHNSRSQHFFDYFFNKILMSLSTQIWADSLATMNARVDKKMFIKTKIISFLIRNNSAYSIKLKPEPNFIFWGRLHYQKNIKFAMGIFCEIRKKYPKATFSIIGPDAGQLSALKFEAERLNLNANVKFLGALSYEEICKNSIKNSFYLQTSLYEGMAMSVIEAMQLGLVPVVTPVGEIGFYCKDGINSLIINELHDAVSKIMQVITDSNEYEKIRYSAFETWKDTPRYKDDILIACQSLIDKKWHLNTKKNHENSPI